MTWSRRGIAARRPVKRCPADLLRDLVAVYMKLAMEAFAQEQKSHPVHMEIVAASWAFTRCGQKSDNDQYDNPDAEHSPHGTVGG